MVLGLGFTSELLPLVAVGDRIDDHHAVWLSIIEAAAGHKTHGPPKPLLAARLRWKPARLCRLLCSERTCKSIGNATGGSKSIDIPNPRYEGLHCSVPLASASVLTSRSMTLFHKIHAVSNSTYDGLHCSARLPSATLLTSNPWDCFTSSTSRQLLDPTPQSCRLARLAPEAALPKPNVALCDVGGRAPAAAFGAAAASLNCRSRTSSLALSSPWGSRLLLVVLTWGGRCH